MTDPTFDLPAAVAPDGTPRKLAGLFSGIGGFEHAWVRAGGQVAWMCEIDPHARKVLAERFPGVPIYTDVRDIDPDQVAAVDVLTGGSPCQSFSVAGMRKGMHGESGLVIEMLRIIEGLERRGLSTVIWENVPGVLTIRNADGTAVWPQLVASFLYGLDPASVAAARQSDPPAPDQLRQVDPATGGYVSRPAAAVSCRCGAHGRAGRG